MPLWRLFWDLPCWRDVTGGAERETGEEQGNDVIEIKAVFKLPDKTEKKYLLRGKNRESLVNDSGECEDWRED